MSTATQTPLTDRPDALHESDAERPSRRRGRARRLIWRLALSLVIVLGIAELGLRIFDLGHAYESEPESYIVSSDPDVLFVPKPGYRGQSEGTQVSISSQGLRDREYDLVHPQATVRILMLGDSVTFGPGVLAEETFSKRLEQRLNGSGAGFRYEVINTGVIGYNTIQERARLEQVGRQFQPDVVVLTFVVNDLLDTFSIFDHQYEPADVLAPLKKWLRRNSRLYHFYQNVSWRLADSLRKDPNRPEQTRDRQRLLEREAEITRIVEISRAHGGSFLLVLYPDNLSQLVTPDSTDQPASVRDEIYAFAAQSQIPVLDLTETIGDFKDPRARTMRLKEDAHPSVAGHQAIADALYTAFQNTGVLER